MRLPGRPNGPCAGVGGGGLTRAAAQHWNHAIDSGRAAARNMVGTQRTPYTPVPFFSSFQLGESVRYTGFATNWDDVIIEGDLASRKFVAYYVKDNRVLAVATMGSDPACVAAMAAFRLGVMPTADELRSGAANSKTIIQRVSALPPPHRGCGGCDGKCGKKKSADDSVKQPCLGC